MRILCVCAALAVSSVGCEAKPGDEGVETAASDGSTTGTATGTATGGLSSTTAATTTEGTTGDAADCAELADEALSGPVTITLRNDGAEPVFLVHAQSCSLPEPLTVAGPDGAGEFKWELRECDFTCSDAIDGWCECPAFCVEDSVLMIAPGGTYTITWKGGMYLGHNPPAACLGESWCFGCLLQRVAPAGTYVLRSAGGAEAADCAVPEERSCAPNEQGWCEIAASGIGGATREASAMIAYPGETAAVLVFE